MNSAIPRYSPHGIAVWVAIAFALVAVVSRFWHLGAASLAWDEYLTLRSTLNILEYGVPAWPDGGYYVRGILLQYISAPFIYFFPDEQVLAFRVVYVTASLTVLPALWILGRRLGSEWIGAAAIVLWTASIAETELSRYARFYGPFVAMYAWYLVFLCRFVVDEDQAAFRNMLVFSAFGPFVSDGGVMFPVFSLLAPLIRGKPGTAKKCALAVGVGLIGLFYMYMPWETIGVSEQTHPDDYALPDWMIDPEFQTVGPLMMPNLLALQLLRSGPWAVLLGLGLMGLLWAFATTVRRSSTLVDHKLKIVVGLALLLVFLNSLQLLMIAAAVLYLVGWIRPPDIRNLPLLRLTSACLFIGIVYAAFIEFGDYSVPAVHATRNWDFLAYRAFLGYPPTISKVVEPYFVLFPITATLLFSLATAGTLAQTIRTGPVISDFTILLASVLLASAIIAATGGILYPGTRYTLHIYPIFSLLAVAGTYYLARYIPGGNLGQTAAVVVLVMAFLLLPGDHDLPRVFRADSPEQTKLEGARPPRPSGLTYKVDVRSAAEFIDGRRKPGDLVFATNLPADFYISKPMIIFKDRVTGSFQSVSRHKGEINKWTNGPMISTFDELDQLLAARSGTAWVMMQTVQAYNKRLKTHLEEYGASQVFQTSDDAIIVLRIPPPSTLATGAGGSP